MLPKHDLLLALHDLKGSLLSDGLSMLDANALRALAEAALNVILGTLPSDQRQLDSLKRYKKDLIRLTRYGTPSEERRRLLQRGGLSRQILSIIAPWARHRQRRRRGGHEVRKKVRPGRRGRV